MKNIIKSSRAVYFLLIIILVFFLTSFFVTGKNPLATLKNSTSELLALVGGASPPPAMPATWTAPAGIVEPPIGINERHTMYTGLNFAPGGFAYRDAGNGPYTHYVDNSVACSDSNEGGYGTQAAPRCTIPAAAAPGAIIEVHGSGYSMPGDPVWYFPGTVNEPIFIRGIGYPTLEGNAGHMVFYGSYFIMEGFVLDNLGIYMGTLSYFAFRNNELRNLFSTAIAVEASNIVFYNNHIHDNGDSENPVEADFHAFKILHNVSNIWILNNHIHHNGGDSIQVGDAGSPEPWAHHIYIAGNTMHDDRENAVDIKRARDVIVSANAAYSYQSVSSASGEIIVIHDSAERIWVLNNFLCCSDNGVVSTSANVLYIMGNVITDINGPDNPGSLYAPAAIHVRGTTGSYIAQNTIWDVENGISSISNNVATYIVNNIVGSVFGNQAHHIALGNTSAVNLSTVETNNLVGTTRLFNVGGSIFNTIATFQTTYNKCLYCQNTDPLFVNAAGNNFALTVSSPMIDMGLTSIQDATVNGFGAAYGAGIALDFVRAPRPVNGIWDIGAYEYWTGGGGGGNPDDEPDLTPPIISGVLASPVGDSTASISWFTNESADSQIEYGFTDTYGSSTVLSTTLSLGRTINLIGLQSGTLYHFRVKSRDISGNLATSADHIFTTSGTPPPIQSTSTPPTGGEAATTTPLAATATPQIIDRGIAGGGSTSPTPSNVMSQVTRTLSLGSSGFDVNYVQSLLISLGYLAPNYNTGFFGPATRAAIQKFQCASGIVCTGDETTTGYGLLGVRTRAALGVGPAPAVAPTSAPVPTATPAPSTGVRALSFGVRGADVTTLQNYLIAQGYLASGYNTGFFGELTRAAVQKFQCDQEIVCSGDEASTGFGTVGPRTRSKMAQ